VAGPDLQGRARLAEAALALRPYTPPVRPRRWWARLGWKRLTAFVVADLIAGTALWHVAERTGDSPVRAVAAVARLAGQGDWTGVYHRLCSADREQLSPAEVSAGGSEALTVLHGLAGVHIVAAHAVVVHLVGPLSLPAEQVVGSVLPQFGPAVDFHVTTVRELTGWKVCLSVGGYGSPALGVDVPLGG
jgi:hypothetical protein